METTFGYNRDPLHEWDTDYNFKSQLAHRLVAATPLGDVDLRDCCTTSDQARLSACAGNATADSIEILMAVAEKQKALAEHRVPKVPTQVSRLFIYSMARDQEGTLAEDKGTYIKTCFDVLARFGVCDEMVWPYNPLMVGTRPSIKAMRQATGHKIHSYYRIGTSGADRLEDIQTALRANHPVVFGTQIAKSFQPLKDSSVVDIPTDTIIGGHAMICVGYLASKDLYIVKNSWGSDWRDGGFAYFTPAYMAWAQTWDLWVPTAGTNLKSA